MEYTGQERKTLYVEESYFDGGLLQYIGWYIIGTIITTFPLGCFCLGQYV